MPFAHIIVPSRSLSLEKKKKMVELVTDAIIAAEEAPAAVRPYVTVIVSEATDGGYGIAGRGYETAELPAFIASLAAGKPVAP
jgi:phenylpyruvate tautomerase PptA (4-oxalocrotonate tautomerase family)